MQPVTPEKVIADMPVSQNEIAP